MDLIHSRQVISYTRPRTISALPHELLAQVFLFCKAMSPPIYEIEGRDLHAEEIISHVSSLWRSIAIGLSALWATIHVDRRVTRARVLRYLERSRSHPLIISLELYGVDTTAMCKVIAPHSHHIQHFQAESDMWTDMLTLGTFFGELSAPLLEYLSIVSPFEGPSRDNRSERPTMPMFSGGAPSLKRAQFAGMGVKFRWPSPATIKTLHLHELDARPICYSRFTGTLLGMASLVSLTISDSIISAWSEDDTAIPIPTLKSLRIIGHGRFFTNAGEILISISAPSLECLSLVGDSQHGEINLEPLLDEQDDSDENLRFPALHSLTCIGVTFGIDDYVSLATAFPTVTRLALSQLSPKSLLDALGSYEPDEDMEILWPHLHTLTIFPTAPDNQRLRTMISNRRKAKVPLQRLRLRSSVLSRLNEKDWVSARVVLEGLTNQWMDDWDEHCSGTDVL